MKKLILLVFFAMLLRSENASLEDQINQIQTFPVDQPTEETLLSYNDTTSTNQNFDQVDFDNLDPDALQQELGQIDASQVSTALEQPSSSQAAAETGLSAQQITGYTIGGVAGVGTLATVVGGLRKSSENNLSTATQAAQSRATQLGQIVKPYSDAVGNVVKPLAPLAPIAVQGVSTANYLRRTAPTPGAKGILRAAGTGVISSLKRR